MRGSPAIRRAEARDGALAVGVWAVDLLVFSAFFFAEDFQIGGGGVPGVVVVVVAAVGLAPLVVRRRRPLAVFAYVWLFTALCTAWLPLYRPTLGLLVALYTVAAEEERELRASAAFAAGYALAMAVVAKEVGSTATADPLGYAVGTTVIYSALLTVPWILGRRVRSGRREARAIEDRRRAEARASVLAERSRIARELHDIVSHSVSVMTLQAAGGRRVGAADPARAVRVLGTIEEVGGQAMAELRRLLGVLSDDEAPTASTTTGTTTATDGAGSPRSGLADLPFLVERFVETGMTVRVREDGLPRPLDPSVDLAAYRVAQEALTNAAKHAGADCHADVLVDWGTDRLTVRVVNAAGVVGSGSSALSTGHGLLGLGERVRAVGGDLTVGPLPDGGFAVEARLPAVPATHPAAATTNDRTTEGTKDAATSGEAANNPRTVTTGVHAGRTGAAP